MSADEINSSDATLTITGGKVDLIAKEVDGKWAVIVQLPVDAEGMPR